MLCRCPLLKFLDVSEVEDISSDNVNEFLLAAPQCHTANFGKCTGIKFINIPSNSQIQFLDVSETPIARIFAEKHSGGESEEFSQGGLLYSLNLGACPKIDTEFVNSLFSDFGNLRNVNIGGCDLISEKEKQYLMEMYPGKIVSKLPGQIPWKIQQPEPQSQPQPQPQLVPQPQLQPLPHQPEPLPQPHVGQQYTPEAQEMADLLFIEEMLAAELQAPFDQ